MNNKEILIKNSRGLNLATVIHHPKQSNGKCIILSHGMLSDKSSKKFVILANLLVKKGFTAVRFDFASRGKSEGDFNELTYTGELDDIKSVYNYLLKKGYLGFALFGSSMGGAVSILFAPFITNLFCLVTIAAPAEIGKPGRWGITDSDLKKGKAQGYLNFYDTKLNCNFFDDSNKHNVLDAVAKIKAPNLILHGDKDELVKIENAHRIFKSSTEPKQLEIIKNAKHIFSKEEHLNLALKKAAEFICNSQ